MPAEFDIPLNISRLDDPQQTLLPCTHQYDIDTGLSARQLEEGQQFLADWKAGISTIWDEDIDTHDRYHPLVAQGNATWLQMTEFTIARGNIVDNLGLEVFEWLTDPDWVEARLQGRRSLDPELFFIPESSIEAA